MPQEICEERIEPQEHYNAPEVVCLGEVVKLTGGGEGTVVDGGTQWPHHKEV